MLVSRRADDFCLPSGQFSDIGSVVIDQPQPPLPIDHQIVLFQIAVREIRFQQPQRHPVERPGQFLEPRTVAVTAQSSQPAAKRLAFDPLHQSYRIISSSARVLAQINLVRQETGRHQIRNRSAAERRIDRSGMTRQARITFQGVIFSVRAADFENHRIIPRPEQRFSVCIPLGDNLPQRPENTKRIGQRFYILADNRISQHNRSNSGSTIKFLKLCKNCGEGK